MSKLVSSLLASEIWNMMGKGDFAGSSQLLNRSIGKVEIEKVEKKCALSGCEVMTSHNGGYCCAEHSKEHQKLIKLRDHLEKAKEVVKE